MLSALTEEAKESQGSGSGIHENRRVIRYHGDCVCADEIFQVFIQILSLINDHGSVGV